MIDDFLAIVLSCPPTVVSKVRYVFDTFALAAGVSVRYSATPPAAGPWILYGAAADRAALPFDRCLAIGHCPEAWRLFDTDTDVTTAGRIDDLAAVFAQHCPTPGAAAAAVPFDLVANAFYFLSSWSERLPRTGRETRRLHANSVFARLALPQDLVDQYLDRLLALLRRLCDRLGHPGWVAPVWPNGGRYAVVLSHDVDFLPVRRGDCVWQGIKTVARHLLHHRDPGDAVVAAARLVAAMLTGRDPYGCIPDILTRERALGVQASFQVAVARRHPADVNYRIEDDRVRDYLQAIPAAGFEVCLHGSYRSTEQPGWYGDEVALLGRRLARPRGSRQHFLSFDYDRLFAAQEQAGIQYDMSMGYPDRPGPRAGFSYPYFPYCLQEDRPYRVLQISLFLMDVTLRSYLGLKAKAAWPVIAATLADLCDKRGCASVVWHPIVFAGARDPGYDRLFWDLIEQVRNSGGFAGDGRTIDAHWRARARTYASFAGVV